MFLLTHFIQITTVFAEMQNSNTIADFANVFGKNNTTENPHYSEAYHLMYKIMDDSESAIDGSYYEKTNRRFAITDVVKQENKGDGDMLKIVSEIPYDSKKTELKILRSTADKFLKMQELISQVKLDECKAADDENSFVTVLTIGAEQYLLGKGKNVPKLLKVVVKEEENEEKIVLAENACVYFAFYPVTWEDSFESAKYKKKCLKLDLELIKTSEFAPFYDHSNSTQSASGNDGNDGNSIFGSYSLQD